MKNKDRINREQQRQISTTERQTQQHKQNTDNTQHNSKGIRTERTT